MGVKWGLHCKYYYHWGFPSNIVENTKIWWHQFSGVLRRDLSPGKGRLFPLYYCFLFIGIVKRCPRNFDAFYILTKVSTSDSNFSNSSSVLAKQNRIYRSKRCACSLLANGDTGMAAMPFSQINHRKT